MTTMLRTCFALLALAIVTSGCGKSSTPPPGAPEQATAPNVDQGHEVDGNTAAGEEAAEAPTGDTTQAPTREVVEVRTADGAWGTLTGRIVFDGKAPEPAAIDTSKDPACKMPLKTETLVVGPDGGLANAVVMLRTKNVKVHPDYEKTANAELTLDNKDCRFVPRVQVVRLSQTLLLKNSDPTGHNSNIAPILGTPINPVLAAGGEPVPYKFTAEEAVPVKVGCNIHPWMGAWIVARKDPYAAVTDEHGNFKIENLPAGQELEFRLWQESPGYLKNATFKGGKTDARGTFKLKLKPGENDLGDIKVPASIFKK
jgi:hypothetical protein